MTKTLEELRRRLLESAAEVESFPHPSHCDHLHVAFKVMREAEAALRELIADAEVLDTLRRHLLAGAKVSVRTDDGAPSPVLVGGRIEGMHFDYSGVQQESVTPFLHDAQRTKASE